MPLSSNVLRQKDIPDSLRHFNGFLHVWLQECCFRSLMRCSIRLLPITNTCSPGQADSSSRHTFFFSPHGWDTPVGFSQCEQQKPAWRSFFMYKLHSPQIWLSKPSFSSTAIQICQSYTDVHLRDDSHVFSIRSSWWWLRTHANIKIWQQVK